MKSNLNMNNHNVIVYTTSSCPFCVYTKEFLSGHNVSFTEKNVQVDRAAAQEMIQKVGKWVFLLLI
jgi:glutaredoxin 3